MELGHRIKQIFTVKDIPRPQRATKGERKQAREFQEALARNHGERVEESDQSEHAFSIEPVVEAGRAVGQTVVKLWNMQGERPVTANVVRAQDLEQARLQAIAEQQN